MCSKKTLDNLEHELQIVISLFFDTVFQRLDSIDMSIYGLDFLSISLRGAGPGAGPAVKSQVTLEQAMNNNMSSCWMLL